MTKETTNHRHSSQGMHHVILLWAGQIVSVITTNMTSFAITLWIFEKTGSATDLGLMRALFIIPFLALSPVVGIMIDRYDRKLMMMISDAFAGIATLALLILQATHMLALWHIYVAMVLQGMGNTFQWPAYSAAISTMVSKEQYGRVNGMMSLVEAGPNMIAPLLAAALLPVIGLTGILLADLVTFILALLILLFIRVPKPAHSGHAPDEHAGFWSQAAFGFRYIFSRPSLLGLQLIFFFGNLFSGMAYTLMAPMILARTVNNSITLGTVQSVGAVAGVAGGIIMSVWGGFRNRVHGVLLGWFVGGLFGWCLYGIGRDVTLWIVAGMIISLVIPIVNSSNQAIWQAKVATDVQGRVFTTRRLIAWFAMPVSPIAAGLVADHVFEPAMAGTSWLRTLLAPVFGSEAGSGMGVVIFICGLFAAAVGLCGYGIPAIRNAERVLPDHDQTPP